MWIRSQVDDGTERKTASGGNSEFVEVLTEWDPGTVDAALGRGVVDTDRTYLRLRRSDGTSVYLYVDTGTTLVVSTTQP